MKRHYQTHLNEAMHFHSFRLLTGLWLMQKKFIRAKTHLIEWQIGSIMQTRRQVYAWIWGTGDTEPANFLLFRGRMACKSGLIGRVPVYQSHLLDFLRSRMCDVWRFPSRSSHTFSGETVDPLLGSLLLMDQVQIFMVNIIQEMNSVI